MSADHEVPAGPAPDAPTTILAFDTATTRVVVALGGPDGRVRAADAWPAGHRHGERLLESIRDLLQATGLRRTDLAAVVVGTGPGAFTGLRVGIATAKALAVGLSVPIVGIPTADALLAAAAADLQPEERAVLLLPAGPSDRIIARPGDVPRLLPAPEEPFLAEDERLVAVDLHGRAPDDAAERGDRARAGLAGQLLRMGTDRLVAGGPDDVAGLVPEYVTLPRGVAVARGEVAWSHDRRPA